MATYHEIQDWIRGTFRFVAQTCWIAHVMSDHGLTHRTASNRARQRIKAGKTVPFRQASGN